MTKPLKDASLPTADQFPEAEEGIRIAKYKLNKSGVSDNQILYDDVSVGQLRKVFESAEGFIDVAKFELEEDYFIETT